MQIDGRLSQSHTFYIPPGTHYHASCLVLGEHCQCELMTVSARIILSIYIVEWITMLSA